MQHFLGLLILRMAQVIMRWAELPANRALTDAGPLDKSGGPASSTTDRQEYEMGWWPLTVRSRPANARRPRYRRLPDVQTLTLATRRGVWTFLHIRGWGTCYRGWTDGRNVRLWHALADDFYEVKKMKRRTPPANAGGAKHLASVESNVLSQCHALVKHCAVTQYDDGEPRKPGWITIKTFGSAWQIEAKDPDSCLTLRVVENSLDEALALLTLLLESDEAPWEQDTWLMQQQQKSRKK